MLKELSSQPEIKLIGLSVRTNNKNEMNPQTARIGALFSQYLSRNITAQIPGRSRPGVTFSVYTDYAADENGDYTYFVGEAVNSLYNIPTELQQLLIPAARYQKFTTPSGSIPEVVITAWQQIWNMTAQDFEGDRAYIADFEVYDQRAANPANAVADIYIGLK